MATTPPVVAARPAIENKFSRPVIRSNTPPIVAERPTMEGTTRDYVDQPFLRNTGTFKSSIARGTKQSVGLAGQLLKSIGDSTGFAGMVDLGDELIQEAFVEAVSNPARIEDLDEATDSFSNAFTFLVQTLGEQVPNLVLAATTGGIGAYLAKAAIGKAALQGIATKALARGPVLAGTVEAATAKFLGGRALKGAAAGTFTGFLPINTGEILQEQRSSPGYIRGQESSFRDSIPNAQEPPLGASLALGAASTVLEVLGFGVIGASFFRGAKKELVELTLRNVLARVGFPSLKSLAAEGGTEAVQEAMVIASRKIKDPTFSITDAISSSEGLSRIAFAGVSGAVVGGVLGGAGGVTTTVVDAAHMGLKRAQIRTGAAQGRIKETFSGREATETEPESARTLFDIGIAQKKFKGRIEGLQGLVGKTVTAAANAVKGALNWGSVRAAKAAATKRQSDLLNDLDRETEATETAAVRSETSRGFVNQALSNIRTAIAELITVNEAELNNDAIHKSSKRISEVLEKATKLKTEQRAEFSTEMLALLEELTVQEQKTPGTVSKDRLRVLHNRIKNYTKAGFDKVKSDLKKYTKQQDFSRTRINNALNAFDNLDIPEAAEQEEAVDGEVQDTTEEQLRTPAHKVVASVNKVIKGVEKFAYAVGRNVKQLPAVTRDQLRRGEIVAEFNGKETILTKPASAAEIPHAKDQDFDTQVGDIQDPDSASVVTNSTREEVVPDTQSALNVIDKNTAKGETSEIQTTDQVVEDNITALNAEVEGSVQIALEKGKSTLAELYRAISGLNLVTGLRTAMKDAGLLPRVASTSKREITVANIPDDLVVFPDGTTWGQFKDTYDDAQHLAELLAALDNKMADPENFIATANAALIEDVADIEDTIQSMVDGDLDASEVFGLGLRAKQEDSNVFFANTKNNRLVPVEVVTNPDGSKRIYVPSGVELAPASKEQMKRKIKNKTSQELFVGANAVLVEEQAGMQLVKAVMANDFPGLAVVLQLAKIKRRGDDTAHGKENKYVLRARKIEERDKDTHEPTKYGSGMWLHLGEVTSLGMLINREANNSSTFDRLTNSHRNFIAGLNSLIADYDFEIDFRPNDIVVRDGKKQNILRGRKSDLNKVIYGQTTYKQSRRAQKGFRQARKLFKEHIENEEAASRWIEYVLTEVRGVAETEVETTPIEKERARAAARARAKADSTPIGRVRAKARAKAEAEAAARREARAPRLPNWADVADWLLDEARSGQIDVNDVSKVLFGEHGLVDQDYLKSVTMEEGTERSVIEGLALVQSTVLGTKVRTLPQRQLFDPRLGQDVVIDEDGIMIREPAADVEYVEKRDITTETELIESTILDAEPDTSVVQRQPGLALDKRPQVSNMLSKGGFEIDEDGNPIPPKAKEVWKQAGKAVEAVLKMLNIKERVTLFDNNTADQLAAGYLAQAKFYYETGDDFTAAIYEGYANSVESAALDVSTGRIMYPTFLYDHGIDEDQVFVAPIEHRVTHIYIANVKTAGLAKRNLVLGHELGHLVYRTHLSRLSPKLQKLILKHLGASSLLNGQVKKNVKEEAFANWMAKAAADMMVEYDKGNVAPKSKIKNAGELTEFFQTLLDSLFEAWKNIKKHLLPYPPGFGDFVAALQTHADVQRGVLEKPKALSSLPRGHKLTTTLGRKIFIDLQKLDAGPFFPDDITTVTAVSDLDLTVDESVDATVERVADPMFQKYFDDFTKWWARLKENQADAGKMLVYTADSELRNMGQVGLWIARQFHALPSSTDPSNTVFREIHFRAARHHSALNVLMNRLPIARISLWEAMFNKHPSAETLGLRAQRDAISKALLLETPESELGANAAAHVRGIRNYLNNLYEWYTEEMGMPLKKRRDYYPMMMDTQAVEQRRAEYIAILVRHNFSEVEAQKHRMKITRDEDGGLNNGFQDDTNTDEGFLGPGATFKQQRAERTLWTPELKAELVAAGFYQHDIATTLAAYTEMMVRRAVWERRYHDPKRTTLDSEGRPVVHATPAEFAAYTDRGLDINHPIAALKMKLAKALESGDINQWQFDRINDDILPAYAGQLGLRTNSHIRKISSGIVIYQNIRLLPMAVFSSFVDVGTLLARGDAWSNHKPALQLLLDKSSKADAMVMLEAIGAMRQGITEHVLNDQALNTFMTGSAKRINDMFFQYNQMEGWTNLMRVMAMVSGREFMQRNADVAINGTGEAKATATQYMNYLGFNEAGIQKVHAWNGHSTTDIDIVAGLNRYIDESMIRPDASIRPVWMSDVGYSVFAHLKGFLYGFQETFLRRVGREAKIHQNYLPLLSLGMLALPFAVVGYELRKKITGSKQSLDGFDYFKEVVERSGLPGAFQLVVDMEQADEFGKPFGLGIGGPMVEQMYDFMTKDMSTVLPKALPGFAQSPPMRDWMRDRLE